MVLPVQQALFEIGPMVARRRRARSPRAEPIPGGGAAPAATVTAAVQRELPSVIETEAPPGALAPEEATSPAFTLEVTLGDPSGGSVAARLPGVSESAATSDAGIDAESTSEEDAAAAGAADDRTEPDDGDEPAEPSPPATPTPSPAGPPVPFPETTLAVSDCVAFLRTLPDGAARLVVTSPPYNVGKEYEQTLALDEYVALQAATITEAVRVLAADGSLCWQVGNLVPPKSASVRAATRAHIVPIDCLLWPIFQRLGLRLRNRIVWTFGHGEHCRLRLSPRYETILWFTKSDDYVFDVDPIRVPQKYPGKKAFRGPRAGQYVCNPLGKNPGDVWEVPNVKSAHPEKTEHPCQFPVELIERLVLSLTRPGDLVVDPYCGVGSSLIAAAKHGRRAAGSDLEPRYVEIARDRLDRLRAGRLELRPMGKPLLDPADAGAVGRMPVR